MINKTPLVSIIMPTYNSAKYIGDSIQSVFDQTYKNIELIIIDDCSTDNTEEIVENKNKNDYIKYYKLEKNSGAAFSRNLGVEKAKGSFIAFIDSDDLWKENKLEKQINYMIKNKIYFSCTYYDKIDENGIFMNKIIKNDFEISYSSLLKNNCGNSTVIYNCEKLGKFFIPNIKKRNDYVMWLAVIKKSKKLVTYPEVLGSHRIRGNSLSSNKISLIKYHWMVYRDIEKLNYIKSLYLILYWSLFKPVKNWGRG